MTLPDEASLETPAGSGAIGAACEIPETPATSTVATAIAHAVRIIFCSFDENFYQTYNASCIEMVPLRVNIPC